MARHGPEENIIKLIFWEHIFDIIQHEKPEGVIVQLGGQTALKLAEKLDRYGIKIIGTRHGEKLYESLLSREEILRVKETDKHFIIPIDNRGLNYAPYFSEGNKEEVLTGEYNSDNTERLNVTKMKDLLMQLPEIKNDPLIKL